MISIPIEPQVKDSDTVFSQFEPTARVRAYFDRHVQIPSQPGFPGDVIPGRGFWLYLEGAESLHLLGNLAKANQSYDIPLTRGWNLIGNPWGAAIPWSDDHAGFLTGGATEPLSISQAIDEGYLDGKLVGYETATDSYYNVVLGSATGEEMIPWKGYMLHADFPGTLRLNPPKVNNQPPIVDITFPLPNAEVRGLAGIIGTASDSDLVQYILEYAYADSNEFFPIISSGSSVMDATLGLFDGTAILNGQYRLRLLAFDLAGNGVGVEIPLQVIGEQKVGEFTLSFVDLTVPVTGMPIQVVRNYDSRDKRMGDFGVGWTLDMGSLQIQENRILGEGWKGTRTGTGFPTYCVEQDGKHVVSLALPDGAMHRFEPVLTPNCQSLIPPSNVQFRLQPLAGSRGKLEILGDSAALIFGTFPGEITLLDADTGDPFDVEAYRYTTTENLALDFSPEGKLARIRDPSGNTLSFLPDKIQHSDGRAVTVERDASGRITRILDPLGHAYTYHYDSRGDLVKYVDALGYATTFRYDRQHRLLDIVDPLGNRAVRNEFDENGRLIATTDAKGNRIELSYDVEGKQQLVRDPEGNLKRYVYDDRGNILLEESSVTIEGNTVLASTRREFDANDNEIVSIDPDGVRIESTYDSNKNRIKMVVDPGGLKLTSLYYYGGGCCDLLSATDANGNWTRSVYDTSNRLTEQYDALNHPTFYEYDSNGRQIRQTDALGISIVRIYDNFGNQIAEETQDATGQILKRKEMTYDAIGNRLTETVYRTMNGVQTPLTTYYAYDAARQIMAVTDPVGAVTRYEYDANGRETAVIDALGRRTETQYDARGKIIKKIYPDGAFESNEYDGNDNLILERSRSGQTTRHEYDELNRRVKTIRMDGSITETVYTPGGRVKAEINARGFRTDYEYDSAGRRIRVIQPLVNDPISNQNVRPVTQYEYDGLGQKTAVIDAYGNRTEYAYDAAQRLVLTTLPTGAASERRYDTLGRIIEAINPEGRVTSYEYDALGRMIAVDLPAPATGETNPRTAYTYDEEGYRLTQTDALGRVTRNEYNRGGQLSQIILPDDSSCSMEYNLKGMKVRQTDYNGDSTQYDYDVMDRLSKTTYQDGSFIEFEYNTANHIASMTDARGVTQYTYDVMDRLSRIDNPDGTFIEYGYDAAGNITRITTPEGAALYSYDSLSRLSRVRKGQMDIVIAYDLTGNRRSQLNLQSFVSTQYEYDAANRLTRLVHARNIPPNSSETIDFYEYILSPSGRREQVTESDGATVDYTYDALDRLIREVRTGNLPNDIQYEYDAVGNRTRMVRNGASTDYTYDARDRLRAEGVITYDYDKNGNRIRRTQNGEMVEYVYDYENRMIRKSQGTATTTYEYDGDGNLVQVNDIAGSRSYLVDNKNGTGYSQVLEERNASGSLLFSYLYGDDLLAMTESGNTHFYQYDGQMSTRLLTDPSGQVTDRYAYDAFGRLLSSVGSTPNVYQYTGERLDPNTGFYYLRARYYDPFIGQFTSMDSYEGKLHEPISLHKYLYVHANPVNGIDPSGHFFSLVVSAIQSGFSRSVQVYNTMKFLCKAKESVLAVSEIYFWATVYAAVLSNIHEAKAGLAFNVTRPVVAFAKSESIKKVEFRYFMKPGLKIDHYIGFSFEKVSGMRVQFEVCLTDVTKSSIKFGTNLKLAEFTLCGGVSAVKIDLASRIIPTGPVSNYFSSNPTNVLYSFWSIGIDVTVGSRWKLSIPLLGKSSIF